MLPTLALALIISLCASSPEAALLKPYSYNAKAPLGIQETGRTTHAGVTVVELSYVSPKGGRVPATLVLPKGKGPFPAVIWGHWHWDNSAFRNRKQFLEESVLLARSGVVSLLIDSPVARPGYVPDRTPLNEKQFSDMIQQVVDMRRGVDLLLARPEVDRRRLGYVGHSYNASVGAVLAGVDQRFKAYVLMAGGLSDEVDLRTEFYVNYRQKVGPEKFDAFVAAHPYSDPGRYIAHAAPAAVFLQFATQEDFLTPDHVRNYLPYVSDPKEFKLYEAPHALNAEARRDRVAFLARVLGFKAPPGEELARVPDLEQPLQPTP